MALTYFGLLPPEILSNCILPRLGDLSKTILRCVYRGHQLPKIPLFYRDAARSDSVPLVQYLISNDVPFCSDKDLGMMYRNIASVRSTEVAGVLVTNFPVLFKKYYEMRSFCVNEELEDMFMHNRKMFAPYVNHVMAIEDYLRLSNASVDPIVRVIAMSRHEYISEFGTYFGAAAVKNNDGQWAEHLSNNGYQFTFNHLRDALSDQATEVIPVIRQQLGLTNIEFDNMCIMCRSYRHVTDIEPLVNTPNKLRTFIAAAFQGAINVMEALAPHIDLTDVTILRGDYCFDSLKWFYDHDIAVNPDSVIHYETEKLTTDLLSKIIQHRDLTNRHCNSIVRDQRVDLLTVLVEAGHPAISQIICDTFNEQIFDLLLRAGVTDFILNPSPSDYFDYLQWAHNRKLVVNKIIVVGYSMTRTIWLIEQGHYYRNKTFTIDPVTPIDEVMKFVTWMKQHIYIVAETILVRGFEANYRPKR